MPENLIKFFNINVEEHMFCNFKCYAVLRRVFLLGKAGQLQMLLRSAHDQWSQHKAALDELNSCFMEARYSLSRFRLLVGSLEAVQVQVDNLQVRTEFSLPSTCFSI